MTMISRRDALATLSAVPFAGLAAPSLLAQQTSSTQTPPAQPMPTRPFAGGERLPVIGLGSSKVVEGIGIISEEPLRAVLRALVASGGRVVDTWPRNVANDTRFGQVINTAEFRDKLFVTGKIDRTGKEAGIAQFREIQKSYGRKTIDLMQIFSMTDIDTHWPSLRAWKDSGEARFIGVTVSEQRLHDPLERWLERNKPDVIQVNYSITERQAEFKLLKVAADRGLPVIVNRPFMNGAYFRDLEVMPVPKWAEEFDCDTWSTFALKFILSNPAVTCVLTETTDPKHMRENAQAALGRMPDEATRYRMRLFIDELTV